MRTPSQAPSWYAWRDARTDLPTESSRLRTQSFGLHSIRIRLLLASTLVQVVLLALLLANSVRLMDNAVSASVDNLISQNAAMLHAVAVAYGQQDDYATLQDVLGELLADAEEGLVYVRIARPDGSLLVSAGRPAMLHLPSPHTDADGRPQPAPGDELIHVRRPLLLDRNQVGFVQFGVAVSSLTAARRAILEQGALIALAEIMLTFVLLSLIGYLLTRNLGRLLSGSQALAEGRLDHRLPADGRDELASLARRFNLMAERLQGRVAELEDTAARLRASEERYALAVQGANDGLWDWDIQADTLYLSPRFSEIAGFDTQALCVKPADIEHYLYPDDAAHFRDQLRKHLKGESAQLMLEHRILLPDGNHRWVLTRGVALRDAHGQAYRMAGSMADIHARRLAEQQLLHDALHDALTGLPNRALFIEHLKSALGQRQRDPHHRFAVLAINLERFRLINDGFGHLIGDQLLKHIAGRIGERLRGGDVAARIGGDQFAVLLNGIAASADAPRFAAALRAHLARPAALAGHTVHPQVRVGVALSDDYHDDAESLLRDADNALHRARRGDNGEAVTIFEAGMHTQTLDALRLESELRTALQHGILAVRYQPVVRLSDRQIASVEALVRWPLGEGGILGPQSFVPLAENLGLIHALGLQVLERCCLDIRRWQNAQSGRGIVPVSINLSTHQLRIPDLAQQLLDTLARHGLPPEVLRVEVTESAAAAPDGPASATLARLRRAGIRVLIDDFGTGYSALSYLHTIPCDTLKLDGSFVRTLTSDARLGAIVRRSIELAHDLEMEVIAECIETEAQHALLQAMGCDLGQGYLYARPLDADALEALLGARCPLENSP
jgi:diguanylate cyclase (GGDEF)-like protein/PAS domain S-box-containing protein